MRWWHLIALVVACVVVVVALNILVRAVTS